MSIHFFSLDWLLLALAAPFIGSFLAVAVARFPTGESIVFGRSACPQCGHRLAASDLVPILSWLLQWRRCRYCKAPIAPFYPSMEIGALLVALSAASSFSGWLLWVSCGFGWILLTVAALDYRYMILPNGLVLPLIPVGLGVSYLVDPDHVTDHIIGACVGFAALALIGWLYRQIRGRAGLGMGDAKLLAASGAWVSTLGLPSVVFLGATAGLLMVMAAALVRGHFHSNQKVPLGSYLCFGTWLVWLFGPLLLPSG